MKSKETDLLVRIKELKTEHGWTQHYIAEIAHVTQGHMCKVLRGKVRLTDAVRASLEDLERGTKVGGGSLEVRTLETLRSSQDFRDLVIAALKMHKKA